MHATRPSQPGTEASHPYGVNDVEKLLRLPRSTIRALIAAGFVSPARGRRRAWLFSFQDLIVLRTAQALADAKVPQRRITRSVMELRRQLPAVMPLSGLSIGAEGDRVVVREGGNRWQAESGQYLLDFEGDPSSGSLSVIERAELPPAIESPASPNDARQWFEYALTQEKLDADAAAQAYGKAIALDLRFVDAHINLGRLLHESKRFAKAEEAYRDATSACGNDPVLLFNLGVLLEDMGRKREAMNAYESALRGDPDLADCHYNLALLYEQIARPKDALRHMARYRSLSSARAK